MLFIYGFKIFSLGICLISLKETVMLHTEFIIVNTIHYITKTQALSLLSSTLKYQFGAVSEVSQK